MSWQTIDTAPKDGTSILAWPCYSGHGVCQVEWKAMKRVKGRWEHQWGRCVPIAPTHWMPLPEPPTPAERSHE